MGLTQIHLIVVYSTAIVLVVAATFASGDDIILQKRQSERNGVDMEQFDDRPSKRPFCNAFTGCGRKRSDESMDTLVELNSEPAVEELNKQILSQAKLFEAMQEARAEMERHREEGQNMRSVPLALALANYRRKRAANPKLNRVLERSER